MLAACASAPEPVPPASPHDHTEDQIEKPAETTVTPEHDEAVLVLELEGFRSDAGVALVGLYRSADGFPGDGARAAVRREVAIVSQRASVRFAKLTPGVVAVSVLHDEDGDKTMKTGFLGRPKEGYGVSRNATRRFGPPTFDDAAVALEAGTVLELNIRLRY